MDALLPTANQTEAGRPMDPDRLSCMAFSRHMRGTIALLWKRPGHCGRGVGFPTPQEEQPDLGRNWTDMEAVTSRQQSRRCHPPRERNPHLYDQSGHLRRSDREVYRNCRFIRLQPHEARR
jgi:hypothetical protein